jgi:glutamate carboxypeptidase
MPARRTLGLRLCAFRSWVALCAGALIGASGPAQARDDALWAAAQAEQGAVLKTLERLANTESGSGDAQGLGELGNWLEGELRAAGATVTRSRSLGPIAADNIVARLEGRGTRKLLLMAHMDTVYERGTLARAPFRVEDQRAYGPGIADAKGGIAVILHTLKLLQQAGFRDYAAITALFNTDEERGSLGSRDLIRRLAAESDAVLSFEPTATPKEIMVRATSGGAAVHVNVKGRAAHSGVNPEAGVNALVEAADIVLRTLDLDDKARDLRFNWTIGRGGSVPNIIPEEANLEANVRYVREADLEAALKLLDERLAKKRLPESQIKVNVLRGRPAFIADDAGRRLIEKAQAIYKEVGGEIGVLPLTGGGTDAAYAAQSGKPVLEGLGLPGAGYHSNSAEYVALDAVPRRLYLALRLIIDISQGK